MKKLEYEDDYKIVMSELGVDPFHTIKTSFALMGIIPLVVIFYIIIGRHFLYHLFLGNDGFIAGMAIVISIVGFFYAYLLVKRMVERLLLYSAVLKRIDGEKSAFVANVSHEFRSPLGIVKESMSAVLDGLIGEINSEQKEILELGRRTLDRLLRLVTDLLDISKIEAGKMEIKREEVDIISLMNEILTIYKKELLKKQIIIKKEIQQNIGSAWIDKDKLSEVMINLLHNAIKHTPFKGNITIGLSGSKEEIRFEISDTGPGIPKESLQKIFNKFERITTERRNGTGLGLPIAKDIIELHKGKIWVESEVGKGSKFVCTLPRNYRDQ